MSDFPIKLGSKMGPCCPEPAKASEEHFPSFYIEAKSKLNIPEEGTMTIKFRRTRVSETTYEEDKIRFDASIDVLSIESIKPEEDSKKSDTGETLDKILETLKSAQGESEEGD